MNGVGFAVDYSPPESSLTNALLEELRQLIRDLGKDGGIISPSVYDTAQVLRFYPPEEGVEPALEWLLDQQQADGGWGDPKIPLARCVPTISAVLAVSRYQDQSAHTEAVEAGVTFLQRQSQWWDEFRVESLPLGAELIIPTLLEEAIRDGIPLSIKQYSRIYRLRDKKLSRIAGVKVTVGSPMTYSWEGWGRNAALLSPDHSGGIGHSPSATARWLRDIEESGGAAYQRDMARQYLRDASNATGISIPGVVPTVWPITGFELSYGLFSLLTTGLINSPCIRNETDRMAARLHAILESEGGVSFGTSFASDVDDTSVAYAALSAKGYTLEKDVLAQFWNGRHYFTFPGELNLSVLSNVHALHALTANGRTNSLVEKTVLEHQRSDGLWMPDKWHVSPRHVTMDAVMALVHLGYWPQLRDALEGVVKEQNSDGGWGFGGESTCTETSYSIITLHLLKKQGILNLKGQNAFIRGGQWLMANAQDSRHEATGYWLGKQLYSPYRVDRIYTLVALTLLSSDFAHHGPESYTIAV